MATEDGLKATVPYFILRPGIGHGWDMTEKWEDPQHSRKQAAGQRRNLFIMVSAVPIRGGPCLEYCEG